MRRACTESGRTPLRLSPEVVHIFQNYRWPGNIRELENVMEHAFVLETEDMITIDSLPEKIKNLGAGTAGEDHASANLSLETGGNVPMEGSPLSFRLSVQKIDFQASKEEFEKQFLTEALKMFKGKINQTAIHANIPKKTLLRKLEKYGIIAKDYNDQD
jgi:DNA-binding NtrC family response regulator